MDPPPEDDSVGFCGLCLSGTAQALSKRSTGIAAMGLLVGVQFSPMSGTSTALAPSSQLCIDMGVSSRGRGGGGLVLKVQ